MLPSGRRPEGSDAPGRCPARLRLPGTQHGQLWSFPTLPESGKAMSFPTQTESGKPCRNQKCPSCVRPSEHERFRDTRKQRSKTREAQRPQNGEKGSHSKNRSPKWKNARDRPFFFFQFFSLSKNPYLLFSTHFPLIPCQESGIALRLQPFPAISVSRSCASCHYKENTFPAQWMRWAAFPSLTSAPDHLLPPMPSWGCPACLPEDGPLGLRRAQGCVDETCSGTSSVQGIVANTGHTSFHFIFAPTWTCLTPKHHLKPCPQHPLNR